MDFLSKVIAFVVGFVLFMAFSGPLHTIFVTMVDVSEEGTVKENMTAFTYLYDNVFTIVSAVFFIACALAIILGIGEYRRMREYERYGGDYGY